MKYNYTTLILFLCLSVLLNSQNFTGNWNVVSLESNGNLLNLPSTVSIAPNINFDNFFSSAPPGYDQYYGSYINGNGICNSFTTYFENETEAIRLIPYFEISENLCNTTEEENFENLFFSILQQPGILSYSFSNNLYNLSFTTSSGEVMNLNREYATTNLLNGEWFIHHIWDFDLLFENTFDPSLNIIFADDSTNGQSVFYGNSTCNGFNGSYDNPIQTSSFIKRNIGWTLNECNSTEEFYFEDAYSRFFNTLDEDIFTFEITGNGADANLIIYNGNGAEIKYGRQALSIDNFKEQQTKLITNLAENKLELISNNNVINSHYAIYDISGRLTTSARLDPSKSIPITTLTSGFYILKMQYSNNRTENFKFFKN